MLLEKLMQLRRDLISIEGVENVELILAVGNEVRGELYLLREWLQNDGLRLRVEEEVRKILESYSDVFKVVDLRFNVFVG